MNNQLLKLLIGPFLFILIVLVGDQESTQIRIIATAVWMLSWWVTTAIPISVTALLPIILFPVLGILSLRETTINYANPVIYLFLGGLFSV